MVSKASQQEARSEKASHNHSGQATNKPVGRRSQPRCHAL